MEVKNIGGIEKSKDKFEIVYYSNNYNLGIEEENNLNLILFKSYHSCDFFKEYIDKMSDSELLFILCNIACKGENEREFISTLDTVYEIAKKRNNSNFLMAFAQSILEESTSFDDILIKTLKIAADFVNKEAYLKLAIICVNYRTEYYKEGIHYAKLGFKNGYNLSTNLNILLDHYKNKNNFQKALQYLKTAAE